MHLLAIMRYLCCRLASDVIVSLGGTAFGLLWKRIEFIASWSTGKQLAEEPFFVPNTIKVFACSGKLCCSFLRFSAVTLCQSAAAGPILIDWGFGESFLDAVCGYLFLLFCANPTDLLLFSVAAEWFRFMPRFLRWLPGRISPYGDGETLSFLSGLE